MIPRLLLAFSLFPALMLAYGTVAAPTLSAHEGMSTDLFQNCNPANPKSCPPE